MKSRPLVGRADRQWSISLLPPPPHSTRFLGEELVRGCQPGGVQTCESHLGQGDDDWEEVGGDGPTEGGRESRYAVQDHHPDLYLWLWSVYSVWILPTKRCHKPRGISRCWRSLDWDPQTSDWRRTNRANFLWEISKNSLRKKNKIFHLIVLNVFTENSWNCNQR